MDDRIVWRHGHFRSRTVPLAVLQGLVRLCPWKSRGRSLVVFCGCGVVCGSLLCVVVCACVCLHMHVRATARYGECARHTPILHRMTGLHFSMKGSLSRVCPYRSTATGLRDLHSLVPWVNVAKGSRQHRRVTLGEALAPAVGQPVTRG